MRTRAYAEDLLALTSVLPEEQGRHMREHLSDEELTVFESTCTTKWMFRCGRRTLDAAGAGGKVARSA